MIALPLDAIGARAEALAARLSAAGVPLAVVNGMSTIGGGSAPASTLATRLLAITAPGSAVRLEEALRRGNPPVIARIEHDRLVLDLRTVPPDQDDQLGYAAGRGVCHDVLDPRLSSPTQTGRSVADLARN